MSRRLKQYMDKEVTAALNHKGFDVGLDQGELKSAIKTHLFHMSTLMLDLNADHSHIPGPN
jgi:hypothetical protein